MPSSGHASNGDKEMSRFSSMSAIRFITTFLRALLLPDKQLNAVNDLGKPLILGNPNRGYNIRHITPDGVVYAYKGNGWYNSETGKTIDERGKKD